MSNDALDKALDILERNKEKGTPEDADGVITEVEVTTREEIFGSGSEYGKDTDPFVQLRFDVTYEDVVISTGRASYPISTASNSKLGKFHNKYGRPEEGKVVEVFLPKNSDYWDIDLDKPKDDDEDS